MFIKNRQLSAGVKNIWDESPAETATVIDITFCLKETVGVGGYVIYITRDGRHENYIFIGGLNLTDCLKEVVLVKEDEIELADVFFIFFNGYWWCLRQSVMYWGPIKKPLTIRADRELPVGMGRDVQTKKNHLPKEVAGGRSVRRPFSL